MKQPFWFLAVLFFIGLFTPAAQASDWPCFRGPGSNGISLDTTLPVKWTKDNFLWKTKLPGPGSASPIVWGDKAFILCYTGFGLNMTKGNVLDPEKKV